MIAKLKEIAAQLNGRRGIKAKWILLTLMLINFVIEIPAIILLPIMYVSKSETVMIVGSVIAVGWLIMICIKSLKYSFRNFDIKLALFGDAESTVKLGLFGMFEMAVGSGLGVLLYVPAVFFFVFKLVYAGVIGYIVLCAKLAAKMLDRNNIRINDADLGK